MRTLFIFCMQKVGVCLNKKEIIQKIIETLETALAEQIDAILSLMEFSSCNESLLRYLLSC